MAAARFAVSVEPDVSNAAEIFSRLLSGTDAPEVPATTAGNESPQAEPLRLQEVIWELLLIPHEQRLACLADRWHSPPDAQRGSAFVESWMRSGVRRRIRSFAAADEPGTEFHPDFLEWFMGEPAKNLMLGVLRAEVPEPNLALAYAVCEL